MEGTVALPTDEEVKRMRLGKIINTLKELGINTDDIEEKDEAMQLLLQTLPKVRHTITKQRQPGKITEMLQQSISENRRKREDLQKICDKILKEVESMETEDKEKMKKFFVRDLQEVLVEVRSFLQNDKCPILVVGETSSGKSSLLNLLLGGDLLPVSHLACTSTLCFVRYGEEKRATVHLKDPTAGTRKHTIYLKDVEAKKDLASYVHRWGRQDAELEEVEKVDIEWPLEFLQGGIYLVDGPGIKAKKKMDEVVAGAVSSTFAFIYVINSANALLPAPGCGGDEEGVDEHSDGLSILMELCQRQKWNMFDVSQFNLESTMFICNKWDCVPEHNENKEAVKKDYLMLLRSHFPELRDDQVFFLSCTEAVGSAGLLSPEFTRLLDGLDALLPQSLQHKLELQYHLVNLVLQKASQYIRLKLHCAYGTQKERKKALKGARSRSENFRVHAKEVLQSLDQMLADTRAEAENHLRTFLTNEALKDSVYQKILNDFPDVDNSEIGSARLITAIADEIDSQLRSKPNSAYNQCIRDADIRLKEEFETKFGALWEQHYNVIEGMLAIPHFPSVFEQLGKFFKTLFFKVASFVSAAYLLAKMVDPNLGNTIWNMVNLAKKIVKMVSHPDNREEYIRGFTNHVFDALTEATAIESEVTKRLKGPIQYLEACKAAIPQLQQEDERLLQDAETETRSEQEIRRTYEPKLDTISQLTEKLCGFYTNNIKKHEFDLTLGKPGDSNWHFYKAGGHGCVYVVEVSKDGGTFMAAVKIPQSLPAGHLMSFEAEAENLRKLKGRHVVKCYGTYRGETDAQGTLCLGLVMEFCPKTLDTEIAKKENSPAWWGSDPEKQAAAFSYIQDKAVQLCEGLKHIHKAGYMHRDLKLDNVLVSSEGVVKLADLGSSKSEKTYTRTKEGTRHYTAPEVWERKKYDRSADMYSMGVILLEMWYGRTINPKDDDDFDKAVPLKVGQELPLPSWDGRAPPIPEWQKLINECLRRSPPHRPTAENCRDRIAGMSLQTAQADSGARAASEVRIDVE